MVTETLEIKGKQIEIQRFEKSLIPHFMELFGISFGKAISEDYLLKKYDTQNLGGNYLGYMAFHDQTPIAYYGVLPVPFILNGRNLTAVQSADTMTHPDYRRHGLFPLLAKKTYQLAKNEGASFVFGWPNQNSYPTFKNKLGWIDLGKMQRFSMKSRFTIPFAKLFFKLPALRPIYLAAIKHFLQANDVLPLGEEGVENCIPRNEAYLNYKEKLGAFSIFCPFGDLPVSLDYRLKLGYLSDFQLNCIPEILNGLRRNCQVCGIDEFQIILSPNSPMADVLLKAGMKREDDLPLMYWPFSEDIKIDKLNLTGFDYDGF